MAKKQIYKITFPNNKIYIGKDLTGTLTYFGSMDSKYVELDFPDCKSLSITKEIIWESTTSSDRDVNELEVKYIKEFKSNVPEIGYNKWPRGT